MSRQNRVVEKILAAEKPDYAGASVDEHAERYQELDQLSRSDALCFLDAEDEGIGDYGAGNDDAGLEAAAGTIVAMQLMKGMISLTPTRRTTSSLMASLPGCRRVVFYGP